MVNIELNQLIQHLYGNDPENRPKYIILGDGSTFYYKKDEDCYALREQTKTIQEGISATEGAGRTTSSECSGTSTVCDGQEGRRQKGQGY